MLTEVSPSVYIPALIAILVLVGSHQLTTWRELRAKRRELRLNYLVKSYRTLNKAIKRERMYEINDDIQEALADIQFLGSEEQAQLVSEITETLGDDNSKTMGPLLHSLRDELRSELGLERVDERISWVRIYAPKPKK